MEEKKIRHWYDDESSIFNVEEEKVMEDSRSKEGYVEGLSSSSSYVRSCGCVERGLCKHAKSSLSHDLSKINITASPDGAKIQRVGLGTHKLTGKSCLDTVSMAFKLGYRLIDTARCYKNEEAIAEALECTNIPRHEIYITSKIDTKEMKSAEKTTEAIMKALINLKLSYLDLMLLHWPGVKGLPLDSSEHRGKRFEAYKALIEARNKGYVKNIGMKGSNVMELSY